LTTTRIPAANDSERSRSPKVLFFCRGRGRGHAIPDIEITRELLRLRPDIDLVFASYSTGGATLAEAGLPFMDLDLPENVRFVDFSVRATKVILAVRPDFVVSHEEFAALPAAKALGIPTTFIVDFFAPIEVLVDSLRYADEILFIERRGLFTEPATARGRVRYVGPVLRPLAFTRADRAQARERLGLSQEARIVAVIPGAWASEERAPLFDIAVPAFERLPFENKQLVWIAGRDQAELSARRCGQHDVIVMQDCSPIESLMVASDLALTKSNRGTTIDLASLGVPSISFSWGLNPVDDLIVSRVETNVALNAKAVDVSYVSELMAETLATTLERPMTPSRAYRPGGAATTARELARMIPRGPSSIDVRTHNGDSHAARVDHG
jgi:UDP-N-acetylglucosamine:LPS N-acetylglucosamine transferase